MADSSFILNVKAKVDTNEISKQLKQISQTTTLNIKVNGQETVSELTKLQDKAGNVYTQLQKLDKEGNVLSKTFTTTQAASKGLGATFESMGRKLQSLNGVFQAMTNLVVNFQRFMEPVLEFEDALTELKKVSALSNDELDSYTKNLGEIGKEVAKSTTEMTEAATEFVKSGFSEEDSATLARVSSLYQNIADEELDAGEAANFIISQMKAFNMTAQDAEHIIDAVNEV
jgi:ElaB/YqjD/DUF883 family membrane-anchored ribosome-binding protein